MEFYRTIVVVVLFIDSWSKANDYLPICVDSEDSKYADCSRLKSAGECEKNRRYMKDYCPLTCMLCTGERQPGLRRSSYPPKCNYTKFGCCKDKIHKALGVNGMGCPENCYDDKRYRSMCKAYAAGGYCKIYKERMLERCPASCKFCKPIQKKPKCKDIWSHKLCSHLKKHAFCTRKSWKRRMFKHCGKTCEHCGIDAPDPEKIASKCAREGNCCWDKVTSPHQGCSRCYNLLSDSYCEATKTFCTDMVHLKGLKIRMHCPATCGMCQKSCADHVIYQDYCKTWKYQGMCKIHEKIMSQYCPRTCGLCAKVKLFG